MKGRKSAGNGLKPPKNLKKAGRELWESVAHTFELEPHDFILLNSLCETLDRKILAEKELKSAGNLTFTNRHGEDKPRPQVAIIRDANILIARLRRELNLAEQPDESRPPRLRYGGPK
jgi:phage terminase small subunit